MSTLFLEAFGQLSGAPTINCEDEDLFSVFMNRSELMRWGAPASGSRPLLWLTEEAELTTESDPHSIGWTQVGLGIGPLELRKEGVRAAPAKPRAGWFGSPLRPKSTDPVLALPPLVQCFSDSLSRFGVVELSALQVVASRLDAGEGSRLDYLAAVLGWFNTNSESRAEAIVAFDQNLVKGYDVSELIANLQWRYTGAFEFMSVVEVPEQHMVKPYITPFRPAAPRSNQGLSVAMPEWTPSAAGWVLASVVDAAREIEPDVRNFLARVTRV